MLRAPLGLRCLFFFVAVAHPSLDQISTDLKEVLREIARVGEWQRTELQNTERWFVTERQRSGEAQTHIGQEMQALEQDLHQTAARRSVATQEAEVLQRRLSKLAEQIMEIGDQREQEFRDAANRRRLQLAEWPKVTSRRRWPWAPPQRQIHTPPRPVAVPARSVAEASPPAEITSFTPPPPGIAAIPPQPRAVSVPPMETGALPPTEIVPFPPVETVPFPPPETVPLPPAETGPFIPAGTVPLPPAETVPFPPSETGPFPPAGTGPFPPTETGPFPPTGTGPFRSPGSSQGDSVTAAPAEAVETERTANEQYQEGIRPLSDEFISISAQREAKHNRITEMSVRIQGLEQHVQDANGRLDDMNQHIAHVTSRRQEILLILQNNEARRRAEFRMLDHLMNLLARQEPQNQPGVVLSVNMRSKFYHNHVLLQLGDQDPPFDTFDVSGELNKLLDQLEETHFNWCREHNSVFAEEFTASKRRLRDARRTEKDHKAVERERIAEIRRLKDLFVHLQRQMRNLDDEEKRKIKELEDKLADVRDAIRKLEDISVVLKRLYEHILPQKEVDSVQLFQRVPDVDDKLDKKRGRRSRRKRGGKRGKRGRHRRKRGHRRRKEHTTAPPPAATLAPEPDAVTVVPPLHVNNPLAPTAETGPTPPQEIVEHVSPMSPFSQGSPALPPVPPEYMPIGPGLRDEVQGLLQTLGEERESMAPEKERLTSEFEARRRRLNGERQRTEEERESMKRTIREEVKRLRNATEKSKDSFDASSEKLRHFELSCSDLLRDFHSRRQ